MLTQQFSISLCIFLFYAFMRLNKKNLHVNKIHWNFALKPHKSIAQKTHAKALSNRSESWKSKRQKKRDHMTKAVRESIHLWIWPTIKEANALGWKNEEAKPSLCLPPSIQFLFYFIFPSFLYDIKKLGERKMNFLILQFQ